MGSWGMARSEPVRPATARDGATDDRIRTARLDLVPLAVGDADEMTDVLGDERLYAFVGGHPPTTAQLRARYARLVVGRSPDGAQQWCNWIARQRDGRAVGTVQATITAAGRAAEIAWVIGVAWQGQGLASEAVRGLVNWLAARGVRTITAHIHPDHHASAAVAARAGLAPTVEMHDGEQVWRRDTAGASWRAGNIPLPVPHLAGIAAGPLLRRMRPWSLPGPRPLRRMLGWPLITAGGVLVTAAVRQAGQVDVEHPDLLMTRGPYAGTRNPMYGGWMLLHLGTGVVRGCGWTLALLPVAAWRVHREVLREEERLSRLFGDHFERYRAAVPRYLPTGARGHVVRRAAARTSSIGVVMGSGSCWT